MGPVKIWAWESSRFLTSGFDPTVAIPDTWPDFGMVKLPNDYCYTPSGVKLWNTHESAGVDRRVGHQDKVLALCVSVDGSMVATTGSNQLIVWSTLSWMPMQIRPDGGSRSICFNPQGTHIATSHGLTVIDLRSGSGSVAPKRYVEKVDSCPSFLYDAPTNWIYSFHVEKEYSAYELKSTTKGLLRAWSWGPDGTLQGVPNFQVTLIASPYDTVSMKKWWYQDGYIFYMLDRMNSLYGLCLQTRKDKEASLWFKTHGVTAQEPSTEQQQCGGGFKFHCETGGSIRVSNEKNDVLVKVIAIKPTIEAQYLRGTTTIQGNDSMASVLKELARD
jgi:hypothetical protein